MGRWLGAFAHAQGAESVVAGVRSVYVPKRRARVRRRVLLPGACRMQQAVVETLVPLRSVFVRHMLTTLKRVAI